MHILKKFAPRLWKKGSRPGGSPNSLGNNEHSGKALYFLSFSFSFLSLSFMFFHFLSFSFIVFHVLSFTLVNFPLDIVRSLLNVFENGLVAMVPLALGVRLKNLAPISAKSHA